MFHVNCGVPQFSFYEITKRMIKRLYLLCKHKWLV
jgi:hypothetical protein